MTGIIDYGASYSSHQPPPSNPHPPFHYSCFTPPHPTHAPPSPLLTPPAVGPWPGRNTSIDSGSVEVGRRVSQEVPPGVFWRSLLHLSQPQFLKFNISLGKDALFGVYIRKGLPPSHAQVHQQPHPGHRDGVDTARLPKTIAYSER